MTAFNVASRIAAYQFFQNATGIGFGQINLLKQKLSCSAPPSRTGGSGFFRFAAFGENDNSRDEAPTTRHSLVTRPRRRSEAEARHCLS
jgi:hypothetical protein